MRDSNQTPPHEPPLLPPIASDFSFPVPPEGGEGVAPAPASMPGLPLPRALVVWLVLLLGFGVGGVALGQQELAMLAAFAGIFVAANAADADRGWRELYYAIGWVVPALGFAASMAVAAAIWKSPLPGFTRAGSPRARRRDDRPRRARAFPRSGRRARAPARSRGPEPS